MQIGSVKKPVITVERDPPWLLVSPGAKRLELAGGD
jgi:hypothetical protein